MEKQPRVILSANTQLKKIVLTHKALLQSLSCYFSKRECERISEPHTKQPQIAPIGGDIFVGRLFANSQKIALLCWLHLGYFVGGLKNNSWIQTGPALERQCLQLVSYSLFFKHHLWKLWVGDDIRTLSDGSSTVCAYPPLHKDIFDIYLYIYIYSVRV